MNIAELSIKKSVVTWTLTVVLLVAGLKAYQGLARLEDPEFAIKDAIITTPYPGASAEEVAEEVTSVIEKACQELGQLKRVQSFSSRDLSVVKASIKDKYDKASLPQVWDELRRKVNDYQSQLPPGAGPSLVNDDFGDVYGVYLAVTGEGYSYAELWDYVDMLQRELLLVKDVKRVVVIGKQPEVVWVEMSRAKMSQFGIPPDAIYSALSAKNIAVTAGRIELGTEYIPVVPTGEFKSEQEFGDLLIGSASSGRLVYLRDVATIRRGYKDPPSIILRYDGKPAVGIGVSTVQGGNVVTMGEAIDERLGELEAMAPLGMDVEVITLQSELVTTAINGFLVNLLEAIAIVVIVLLVFMGLRSGLIIGAVLFLTIMGTFIFMKMWGVILERISLGALIIALGMLVDNAIVVADGMKVRMQAGKDALTAAKEVVGQTAMPLLGATAVAVMAFASIGTSKDSTGEFCRSLFQVILISLTLSWLTAVTVTPLFCSRFLMGKPKKKKKEAPADPYGTKFYRGYRSLLEACIRGRWVSAGVIAAVFALSLWGFGFVKQSFFPDSTRDQFFVQFYFPEGMHIRETARRMQAVEAYVDEMEGVEHVSTIVGGGHLRFLLTYQPERGSTSFGEVLVTVDDYKKVADMVAQCQRDFEAMFPEAIVNARTFLLGPGEGGKIQMRIYGPDVQELRRLARLAEDVMRDDPGAKAVRNESKEQVKVVRPVLAEAQARRAGLDRSDVAVAIQSAFSGTRTGVYREGEELLPIIARAPESERIDVDNLRSVQIWSPVAAQMIPIQQVVTTYETTWEDANIMRWNRAMTIRLHCDPRDELPSTLFARIKPKIEKALGVDVGAVTGKSVAEGDDPYAKLTATTIPVREDAPLPLVDKPGYALAWGGQAEDSARANAALAGSIPVFVMMMVLIVIVLFNSIRQPLVIWLCVPLALIGVTGGLLAAGQPFGFMSLLGLLSLSGMLIKNAIVLVDEINANTGGGMAPYDAVVAAGVSRVMPVSMAALTTILGMAPLLKDAFFVAMAVTIMAGLGVATVLTLLVLPVFYAIILRVPSPPRG